MKTVISDHVEIRYSKYDKNIIVSINMIMSCKHEYDNFMQKKIILCKHEYDNASRNMIMQAKYDNFMQNMIISSNYDNFMQASLVDYLLALYYFELELSALHLQPS